MNRELTVTVWNANGLERQAVSTVTTALSSSSLIFITESWLLSPLRLPTSWPQHHNYGSQIVGVSDAGRQYFRGSNGITLLVNPDCKYHVHVHPVTSPYVLSVQVSTMLIHCCYFPPSLGDEQMFTILNELPISEHPSQLNTMFCGDFNARHESFLGDSRTNSRGTLLLPWLRENGLQCWNATSARGQATYFNPSRLTREGLPYQSIIDLIITSENLIRPRIDIRTDYSLGSDHHPVSLSFLMLRSPPPPPTHPRLLWNLSRLSDENCAYVRLFRERVAPLREELTALLDGSDDLNLDSASGSVPPDIERLGSTLVDVIHSSLDDSVGRREPRAPGNAWFWTPALQDAADYREDCRRWWHDEPDALRKLALWPLIKEADVAFKRACKKRKRETWKDFCKRLSSEAFSQTTSFIKGVRRTRTVTPQFTHPEGPAAAASEMARHLRNVFAGDNLPDDRQPAPPRPIGPHPLEFPDQPSHNCPFDEEVVASLIRYRLARRKAPGYDHLRCEMFLPILWSFSRVVTLLFKLCWRWSMVPRSWCTAQVIPIYKKGDHTDPGNFRPISLTSSLRKLLELCLQDQLTSTAPPLDIAQGGFRAHRGAPDQALCLHELCVQHSKDHYGEPPVLAFLDIKSAYDTVDRAIIWRALETYVSAPLLGLLQSLFDSVHIEVLLEGYNSSSFMPATGVLQGSILSPFLYSVYINKLPGFLRKVRVPISPAFDQPPQRLYDGLWLNCLLYADDVALIGTADTMPRLLKTAELHSKIIGYRWNPQKCVIVNPPSLHGGRPLKLYGSVIPTADSFTYLGLPISAKGHLDTGLLLDRNTHAGVSAMRSFLQPLGLASASFSRVTAAKLYTTFIRPKFEYGLAISTFLKKDLKALEKAQDTCLRLAFGGHKKSSTAVFKHMTNLPAMSDRVELLRFKMVVRAKQLPRDTLLATLIRHCRHHSFRWPKLVKASKLWSRVPGATDSAKLTRMNQEVDSDRKLSLQMRQEAHNARLDDPEIAAPVLLAACRRELKVDPILYLPMSDYARSRLRRWRMGWLPARKVGCPRCGAGHASRNHLIACLDVARRLGVPASSRPNPLDFFLNTYLPEKKVRLNIPLSPDELLLCQHWPVLCAILSEIEQICLPDEDFTLRSDDSDSYKLINWYRHREWPRITTSSYVRILEENA
jgi:hypothetical protein